MRTPRRLSDQEVSWVTGELDPHDLKGHLADDFPWRDLVFKELLAQGLPITEAEEFRWCGSNFRGVKVCSEDITHSKAVPISCHRRYCPTCARRAAAALVDAYVPQVLAAVKANEQHGYRMREVTLTTKIDLYAPDVRDQVKAAIQQVNQFFDLVGGSKLPEKYRNRWSEPSHEYYTGEGLLFGVEFGPNGNKLHFHCLWFGRYIDKYWMSQTWQAISGYSINWIEAVTNTEAAVRESLKYATKLVKRKVDQETGEVQDLYPSPKHIARLAYVLHGMRRVFSRGCFRGIRDDVADQDQDKGCKCDKCGAKADLIGMTAWTGLFYTEYLRAMRQLDLRPGNNSADPPETAPPASRPVFGRLLTDQALEDRRAILRSQWKFTDDEILKGRA